MIGLNLLTVAGKYPLYSEAHFDIVTQAIAQILSHFYTFFVKSKPLH